MSQLKIHGKEMSFRHKSAGSVHGLVALSKDKIKMSCSSQELPGVSSHFLCLSDKCNWVLGLVLILYGPTQLRSVKDNSWVPNHKNVQGVVCSLS